MTHRHHVAAGLLLLVVALSGCSGGEAVGNGARNAAYNDLRSQLDAFQKLAATWFDEDPARFFSEGAIALRGIGRAQTTWIEAADAADLPESASRGAPSRATVEEFNSALEGWITVQEEQARLSAPCLLKVGTANCYQDIVEVNNDRWNAIGERFEAATKQLTGEANS